MALTTQLRRIGAKFFLRDGAALHPRDLVPVFHRWIQTRALSDLLIDVADYDHVADGPRVVLVGHEGNYSLESSDGRTALCYAGKRPGGANLDDRIVSVIRSVARAARLLEEDSDLGRAIEFDGGELLLFANDRLRAPNSEATLAALRPALDPILQRLFGEAPCKLTPKGGPGERFALIIQSPRPVALREVAERLAR